jgi:hypothetical protein
LSKTKSRQATDIDCYSDALRTLIDNDVDFMVGGAYALREYADIVRDTKDFDMFCLPRDYQTILDILERAGYHIEITDPNWIGKAYQGDYYVDVIFGAANLAWQVDETWFENARTVELLGATVKLVPPEEVMWSKMYVQDRSRFDGADVAHIIRKSGDTLDWERLLKRMDLHWELLLSHLVTFGFIYPSDRARVPEWLMKELLSRLDQQLAMPEPKDKICRGWLLSKTQYGPDIAEWGYKER